MSFLSRLTGRPPEVPALPYAPTSPEGLAARWIQWVASVPADESPLEDETGERAHVNQPDDVWFLAGSYGTVVSRRCVVPAGRDLFLPVFNMWHKKAAGPPPPVEDAFGALVVDGVDVEPDLIATPTPFTVAGARFNGVTMWARPVPMTVWGLWKRISAPAPGEHTLRAVGGDGHGFTVDVSYRLQVARPTG